MASRQPTRPNFRAEEARSPGGQATAFSETMSDDGRNGAGYDQMARQVRTSSNKAQVLANEIADIEQRCDYLEERNRWLNEKMIRSQRAFIEKAMVSQSKNFAGIVFKGWKDSLNLLGLENQLEQQTISLDKCQQVAKELGAALAREQETSRMYADGRRQIEADFDELAQAHSRLKTTSEKQTNQINSLSKQMSLATQGLERNKANAQSTVEDVDDLQAKLKEMKKLEDQPDNGGGSSTSPGQPRGTTIADSAKLREEAQNVMKSMNGLLEQDRLERESMPGNSPGGPNSRRPGLGGGGRSGDPTQRGGSRMARTPSPMEGRFQADLETPTINNSSEIYMGSQRADMGRDEANERNMNKYGRGAVQQDRPAYSSRPGGR